ncbi:methyltransferase domain-containing protein [Candidatus Woesearchaeota archaeon]|nr:methyltransferase domain-containing protein [Candidatus Woesearchaeota archaeon]
MQVENSNNWHNIAPRDYLEDLYSDTDKDGEGGFLMNFFHKAYANAPHGNMLEVGGGPTIYQLISASAAVKSITFSEYSEEYLNEVRNWLNSDKDAFNWDEYFKIALKLEGKETTPENLATIKKRLKDKLTKLIRIDLFSKKPLGENNSEQFDIISTNFCPEAISATEPEFIKAMSNMFSLLKKSGLLVMSLARNGHYYASRKFRGFPADENYIRQFLQKNGFANINLNSVSVNYEDEGYDGIITLTAIKSD